MLLYLKRTGDGGGASMADKRARHRDFPVDEHLHQLRHQFKGRTLHLLVQFAFILFLQTFT